MQSLVASPRESLTAVQVQEVLAASLVAVDLIVERVDPATLLPVEDISEDVSPSGGSVSWDASSGTALPSSPSPSDFGGLSVNRDCSFAVARELQWGTDLVRLTQVLTADGITAQFYLGVFCLTTPENPSLGADQTLYQVTGYDRLYLLQREIGDTYSVPSGAGVLDAVDATIAAAGLTGVTIDRLAATATTATAMVWPLVASSGAATTWLDVVNELLKVVAYDPLWADEQGVFRSQPHLDLASRPSECTFDAADAAKAIVGQVRTLAEDQWAAPNKWIFVQSGYAGTPTEGDGLYTVVNSSDGPSSVDQRGMVWPRQYTFDAADQATLEALGDAQVAADRQVSATFTVPTSPLPICGHDDVISYTDPAVDGGSVKALAVAWSLPLDGTDMSWTLQVAS